MSDTSSVFLTSRNPSCVNENTFHFDLQKPLTWYAIAVQQFDVIINASGYGVVKDQLDLTAMYEVNHEAPLAFSMYLQNNGQRPLWIQIGTAFEYNLNAECLTEQSDTTPNTHYGISKLLFSNFLQSDKNKLPYIILRPFAMYGPYENRSKLFPYLIGSQIRKEEVMLSSGVQQRDYFYVRDLANFVELLVKQNLDINGEVYNLGSGIPVSIKELAQELSAAIPNFDAIYWGWNQLSQRPDESNIFFNASTKAHEAGFKLTPRKAAIQETTKYFLENL